MPAIIATTFESLLTQYNAKMNQRNQFLTTIAKSAQLQQQVATINTDLEKIAAEMSALQAQGPVTTTTLPTVETPATTFPQPTAVTAGSARPAVEAVQAAHAATLAAAVAAGMPLVQQ